MIILFLAGWLAKRGLSAAFANFLAPVIVYGVIGLAAWFGGPWLWNRYVAEPYRQEGRVEERLLWEAAVKKEEDRRRQEQEELIRKYETELAKLRDQEEKLNEELIALAVEAANDPAADSCGLSPDSVRRIFGAD